jgi:hypothetical protein
MAHDGPQPQGGPSVEDQSRQERSPRQERPSMIKHLLITASVALVCGVSGAMGYVYFFGPTSKESSPDQSQAKSDPGSKKKSDSKVKPGVGENKPSGDDSSAHASTAHSTPAVHSATESDTVKNQIHDLSQRVDNLLKRVEGVTRPIDQTPPALRMMQIKVTNLAHEIVDLAALPAAYQEYDNRLETLKEELSALRARIEPPQADSVTGRMPGDTKPAAPTPSTGGRHAGNPAAFKSTAPTTSNAPSGGP